MGDAFTFEDDDRFKEVLAEALEKVEAEAAFLAQTFAQRLVAGPVEENSGAVGEMKDAVAADDQRAVEFLKHLTFVLHPVVVIRIDRDLGDIFLILLADQHGNGRGTGAEFADDFVPARQDVARLGLGGIANDLVARRRQFFLDLVEQLEEFGGGVEAITDVRIGAVLDELIEGLRCAIHDGADAEATVNPQFFRQGQRAFRRCLAGEELIAHRA